MSLRVSCACGKSFNAQPKLAGKTVACPTCGNPLRIPQAAASTATATATASTTSSTSSNTIRVACACGKSLTAKLEHAGRKARCPACGAGVLISAPAAVGLGQELDRLDSTDPFADDPLGLGDFDEQAMSAAPLARPSALKPATKSQAAGGFNLKLAWTIGASVGVVGLLIVLVVTLVIPEMKKLQQASETNDEEIAPTNISAMPTRPSALPGQPGAGVPNQAAQPPAEWVTYNSAQHHYSILMPFAPVEKQEQQNGATLFIAQCETPASAYFVLVVQPPAEIVAHPGFRVVDAMDGIINSQVKAGGGEELGRETMLIDGHPARQVTYTAVREGKEFRSSARFIAVDRNIYCLINMSFADPGPDLEKFFDSFKLTEQYTPANG